jgi:hypothetical protein
MRHEVSRDLFAYWNGLRGARAAPDRAHIDPAAIRAILADVFIVEIDADGVYPFRFSGARVNALACAEQRGESFVGLWGENDRPRVADAVATVVDDTSPVIVSATTRAPGDARLDLEVLLLPLRHFGKTHARVLGALSPFRQADWLGERCATPFGFTAMRVLAEAGTGAVASTFDRRRRGGLRLVVSNQ